MTAGPKHNYSQLGFPTPLTSWSLLGPGVEVGLSLSFIDYVRLSLKQSNTAPAALT